MKVLSEELEQQVKVLSKNTGQQAITHFRDSPQTSINKL